MNSSEILSDTETSSKHSTITTNDPLSTYNKSSDYTTLPSDTIQSKEISSQISSFLNNTSSFVNEQPSPSLKNSYNKMPSSNAPLSLNVGGFMFQLCPKTLQKSLKLQQMVQEALFIDRDAYLFGWIVQYLRTGEMEYPNRMSSNSYITVNSLQKEFQFFGLEWPQRCFHCDNLFDPSRNTCDSCVYHPGSICTANLTPTIQTQFYDCCNKKLDSIGCRRSSHLNEVLAVTHAFTNQENNTIYPEHNLITYSAASHSPSPHEMKNLHSHPSHENLFTNTHHSQYGHNAQDEHSAHRLIHSIQNLMPPHPSLQYTNIPYHHSQPLEHIPYSQTYCHSTHIPQAYISHIYSNHLHGSDVLQTHSENNLAHIDATTHNHSLSLSYSEASPKTNIDNMEKQNERAIDLSHRNFYKSNPIDDVHFQSPNYKIKNGLEFELTDTKSSYILSQNNNKFTPDTQSYNNTNKKSLRKKPILSTEIHEVLKESAMQYTGKVNDNLNESTETEKKTDNIWRICPEEGKQVPLVLEKSVVHKTQTGKMCIHPDGSTVILPSLSKLKSASKSKENDASIKENFKSTSDEYIVEENKQNISKNSQTVAAKDSQADDNIFDNKENFASQMLQFNESRYKTKMCPLLKIGCCSRNAEDCNFAHSFDDLRPTDDLYKTKLCAFYSSGYCKAGTSCRHAHGESDVRLKEHSSSNLNHKPEMRFVWFETDNRRVQIPISKIPPCFIQQK